MKQLLYILFAGLFLTACSADDLTPTWKKIYIELSTTSATTLTEDSETAIDVTMMLARPVNAPATVNVMLEGNEDSVLTIDQPAIHFEKGEQIKHFKVLSNNKDLLLEPRNIVVRVKDFTDPDMYIWKDGIGLIVNPSAAIPPVTEEQKELMEGYKRDMGIDVSRMMGKLSCQVKIIFPIDEVGETGETVFSKTQIQEYTTQSVITLSEKATANKPVLKMVDNALGLSSIFRNILEKEISIKNQVGTSFPSVAEVVKYVPKDEQFSVSLDDIVLKKNGVIQFVGKVEDSYGDKIKNVPFLFAFSAWERQVQMAEDSVLVDVVVHDPNTGDIMYTEPEAPMGTLIEQGLTFNPSHYLFYSDIGSDSWESGIWKAPVADFNMADGKMKFVFSWDHQNSSDWTLIEVTYTLRQTTR